MSTGEPRAVRSRWSALPLFSAGPWGCTPANPPQGQREREREMILRDRVLVRASLVLSPLSCHARQRVHTLSAPDPRSRTIDISLATALNYRNASPSLSPPFSTPRVAQPFNFQRGRFPVFYMGGDRLIGEATMTMMVQ